MRLWLFLVVLAFGPARAAPDGDCAAQAALVPALTVQLAADDPDAIQASLAIANALARCEPGSADALEAALTASVRRQVASRVAAGCFREARDLLAPLVGRLDVGEDLRAVERAWGDETSAAAGRDEAAGRFASALVRASTAATLTREPKAAALRDRLAESFWVWGAIALDLTITGPTEPRQRLEEVLPGALSPLLRPGAVPPDLRGAIALEEPTCAERTVARVAALPVPAEQRDEALQHELAEAHLGRAQADLDAAAGADPRLREALVHRADPEPSRRTRRALEHPLVLALADAEAVLSAHPAVVPADPFTFTLTEHTRACTARARLQVERPGQEPLEREVEGSAQSTDAAHPAVPERGLDEDPLVFSRSESQLRQQALAALAAEVDAVLAAERDTRGLATAPRGDPPADPEALEAATRRMLLALLLDRSRDRATRSEWLEAAFGIPDLDALAHLSPP